jgi:hypothetical protein
MSGHARLSAAGGQGVRGKGGRRKGEQWKAEQWKAEEGVGRADEPSLVTGRKWTG